MGVEPGLILKKDEILKRITQEEIFEKYLGLPVDETATYHNPHRVDKNPSCKYYYKNGKLRFHDWGKFNWDCFSYVQYIHSNCSFIEVLRIIVNDFKLNKEIERYDVNNNAPLVLKSKYNIKIATREWNLEDINYWKQYSLSPNHSDGFLIDNVIFYVYPCKAIWINEEYYRCRTNDVCFAYYFGNNLYKLYFPWRAKKEGRFFTNITYEDNLLQGYLQLPETGEVLIYTKSYKDVISLRSFGIYAVAPQSESQIVTKELHEELQRRFKYIFTLGDHDNSGRNFCHNHYRAYNIGWFIFPWTMEKDFTDNVKKYGRSRLLEIINTLKENNL